MTTRQLAKLQKSGQPYSVKFVQSSCGPMVIQVCFHQDGIAIAKLIKDMFGKVVTCQNLAQAYAVCRSAGVRKAELIQTLPHLEACATTGAQLSSTSIALSF